MFEEIVNHFGSRAAMSRALGVSRSAVSQWEVNGLPAKRVIQIHEVCDGKFPLLKIFYHDKARVKIKNEYAAKRAHA